MLAKDCDEIGKYDATIAVKDIAVDHIHQSNNRLFVVDPVIIN